MSVDSFTISDIFKEKKAKKSFGQHFLINKNIVKRISETVTESQSTVCEIGPGTCKLTEGLIANHNIAKIIAMEVDQDLYESIHENLHRIPKLEIIKADATNINWKDFRGKYFDGKKIILISNLPYNHGTQIIYNIIKQRENFSYLVVMLQKEVADKIMANHGQKNYSSLSTTCQINCNISKVVDVSPGSFSPPPKVQSTVIKLEFKQSMSPAEYIAQEIFKLGFQNRRKTIKNNLNHLPEKVKYEIFKNINPSKRMEEISVKEMIEASKGLVGIIKTPDMP